MERRHNVCCVVLVCVFTFCLPCCDVPYDFNMITMLDSSLSPVVCRRTHVLFTLFVFVCIRNVPDDGYSRNVPDDGYSRNVPDDVTPETYLMTVTPETYLMTVTLETYLMTVTPETYLMTLLQKRT